MTNNWGRKLLLLLLLLGIISSQPACWDRREVEQLIIVGGIGIESAPAEQIRVIVQVLNPRAVTGAIGGLSTTAEQKSYRNLKAEGDTVFEAIRRITWESPRRPFYGHTQVILLDEGLVRERSVQELLDFFERDHELRRNTWLLVSRSDLVKLMDTPGLLDPGPAMRLARIIRDQGLTSQYAVQPVGDFLEMLESEGTDPFTAGVELRPNLSYQPEHTNDALPETEPEHTMLVNGTAVFQGDKLAGWLNATESRGVLWVRGQVKSGTIQVPAPGGQGKPVALEILGCKSKLQPELRDGQLSLILKLQVESNVAESRTDINLNQPEIIRSLEDFQAEAIRAEIQAALARAQQEYRTDVFGFGEAVHRKYPGEWREMKDNWLELLPAVPVQIEISSKIRRTGLITRPAGLGWDNK